MIRPPVILLLSVVVLGASSCAKEQVEDNAPIEMPTRGTEYPIILAHGIMAGPSFVPFDGVPQRLRQDGHVVEETETHPVGSLSERAALLGAQVDELLEETGAPKVNLICHSMGGLDARWLAANGWGSKIASITTVSTPHRGSRTAKTTRDLLGPTFIGLASDVAATFNAHLLGLPKYADFDGMLYALSEEHAERFNEETPDADGVYYQSFAGVARTDGTPRIEDVEACGSNWPKTFAFQVARSPQLSASAALAGDGPSDGVVPVASAKWGEFRGCLAADHMDQIGFYGDKNVEGERFDHITFYRLVAADLAEMGY